MGATSRCALLHSDLKTASRLIDEQLGWLFAHYLVTGLVMPLVSTAEVILSEGRSDSFALGSIPIVVLVFVSQVWHTTAERPTALTTTA